MIEAFYEESAVNAKAKSGEKKYKVLNVFATIFLVLGIISLASLIFTIPIEPSQSNFNTPQEYQKAMEAYQFALSMTVFLLSNTIFFWGMWAVFFFWKRKVNISFDYCFVSGELRISKVFNVNKRKLVARIQAEDILQLGDVENTSYDRLSQDPNTKQIICTPNVEALEGKFFMYILVADSGKQLYVLECRELLLMNILKFARRGVLETDYVMQEKKQR